MRWFYDFIFFVLVLIILLNIVFGIIIDAFGDLRDKRNDLEENINGKCFICGLPKFMLDTKGEGWYKHIYKNHNVYNYMFFYIAMQEKDMLDCNGVEKYIKEKISQGPDISFIPQGRAIGVKEFDKEELEEVNVATMDYIV